MYVCMYVYKTSLVAHGFTHFLHSRLKKGVPGAFLRFSGIQAQNIYYVMKYTAKIRTGRISYVPRAIKWLITVFHT